ncbi:hypothetical protein LXM60_21075 [Pandoraea sputorum]|uniref:hypothetical protein n=1 Tax=Pandoraea sputorum TaxID=93222 RepID=UPI001E4EB8E7|nr:hypothetical protein [Pandoraea sputorum]MCE4062699.1 hypothetical protein [Pandoraea sputorum]
MDAAKRVFAEKCGRLCSADRLLAEARVASLYQHFPTHDDVISAEYRQKIGARIEATNKLISHSVAASVKRSDVKPLNLLRALSGVASIQVTEHWKCSAVQKQRYC